MRTRAFSDGALVSAIGCGDVSLATAAKRNVDAGSVTAALELALGLGITFIDIAAEEDAERLVGTIVRGLHLRDAVMIATRVAVAPDTVGVVLREVLEDRMPPAHIQARVEASLRALKLDALPLAQLSLQPSWCRSRMWSEVEETCARLVREGKVLRWAGRPIDEPAPVLEPDEPPPPSALDASWLAAIALPFSMCERKAALPVEKVIALAHRPLAGGALAGALGPGAKLALKDDRRDVDEPMLVRYAVMAARLAPFVKHVPPSARSCAESRGYLDAGVRPERVECETLAELALRWAIDRGVLALPRLHRKEHVTEAAFAGMAAPLVYDPMA